MKMQTAWKGNEERKEGNREAEIEKKVKLGAPVQKPPTKTAEKKQLLEQNEIELEARNECRAEKRKVPAESDHGDEQQSSKRKVPDESVKRNNPAAKNVQKTKRSFFT